jgi:hypothetical protein
MGEFLVTLVVSPLRRRLRMVGPSQNMAWVISAVDESSDSFLRPVFFMRQSDWTVTQSKQVLAYVSVPLSFPVGRLLIWSRTHV